MFITNIAGMSRDGEQMKQLLSRIDTQIVKYVTDYGLATVLLNLKSLNEWSLVIAVAQQPQVGNMLNYTMPFDLFKWESNSWNDANLDRAIYEWLVGYARQTLNATIDGLPE